MKITTEMIAKEAGVSRATVSRVLNNHGGLSEATVVRINSAMDRLGYTRPALLPGPKPRAGVVPRASLKSVGLVVVSSDRGMFMEPTVAVLVEGLQQVCRARRINLVLEQMDTEGGVPFCVESGQVDGVILMILSSVSDRREVVARISAKLPCVHVLGPSHPFSGVDHVTVNDVAIGALAFRELESRGCRSYVVVDAMQDYHEAILVRSRAFLDRCLIAGRPSVTISAHKSSIDGAALWHGAVVMVEDAQQMAAAVLESSLEGPVGVFFAQDHECGPYYQALSQAGVLDAPGQQGLAIVAGVTPAHVEALEPAPLLIDICLPRVFEAALDRLLLRATHPGGLSATMQIPPQLG